MPLGSANDVVVAAVRLAYDVANAQIDRSDRLARRLREAGDRATGDASEATALDAVDGLVTKALMSGLEWWETSVAQGRCPTTRLFAAEYRLLGTMLGFIAPSEPVPPSPAAGAVPPSPAAGAVPLATALGVVIVHLDEPVLRRAVTVEAFVLAGTVTAAIYFCHCAQPDLDRWQAQIDQGPDGRTRLSLATGARAAGNWRAAICDADGVQLGMIEIAL